MHKAELDASIDAQIIKEVRDLDRDNVYIWFYSLNLIGKWQTCSDGCILKLTKHLLQLKIRKAVGNQCL